MKEFNKEILINEKKEILNIKINEDFLKEAVRVNWESLYFTDEDILAVATLGNKKLTIDVCGDVRVSKNDSVLELDEIRKLIDTGVNIWECEDIEIWNNNWFSLNCYACESFSELEKNRYDCICDEVMESEFKDIDEVVDYLVETFQDEDYMERFN